MTTVAIAVARPVPIEVLGNLLYTAVMSKPHWIANYLPNHDLLANAVDAEGYVEAMDYFMTHPVQAPICAIYDIHNSYRQIHADSIELSFFNMSIRHPKTVQAILDGNFSPTDAQLWLQYVAYGRQEAD